MKRVLAALLLGMGFSGFFGQALAAESVYFQSLLAANSASDRVFIFDPKQHKWYALEDGRVIKSGVASGGADYCSDVKRACRTPSGTYKVILKRGADCRSSRYPLGKGGAPMGYCVFFSKYYAIHASNNVPADRNASHGCIRVKNEAAKWLNQDFLQVGDTVIVKPY